MDSRNQAQSALEPILTEFRRVERNLGRIALVGFLFTFFVVALLIWTADAPWNLEWDDERFKSRVVKLVSILIAFSIFWLPYVLLRAFALKPLCNAYCSAFPTPELRQIADGMLLSAAQSASKYALLPALARKLGVIARRFTCRGCGHKIKSSQFEASPLLCDRCRRVLKLTSSPPCPRCGDAVTMLRRRGGQPDLPPGIPVYDPPTADRANLLWRWVKSALQRFNIELDSYTYVCSECHYRWAVQLWPAA